MGNKALRKEVKRLLKENNIPGKLYYGDKTAAFTFLNAGILKELINNLSFKVGEYINDCDGFNHRIKSHIVDYKYTKFYGKELGRETKVLNIEQVVMDNDCYSCGSSPLSKPWSKEKITSFWKEMAKYYPEKPLAIRVLANEEICNELGELIGTR